MLLLSSFFLLTYIICSFQIKNAVKTKIPHNSIGKYSIKVIKFFRRFYPKFSFKLFFDVADFLKCPLFVLLSAILFNNKSITDATAIVSYVAHYFPIWSGFHNSSRNFIGIIFTGFILDPITGISMIFAYLLSARSFGYTSVATTSSMMVGMIKTVVHIAFFNSTDYVEAIFFIFFGVLAIYRNKRILLYICEKSVKKDIKFYRFSANNKKTKTFEKNNFKQEDGEKKYKKIFKKNFFYRNYKKYYKNNQKLIEKDRRYER